LSYQWSFNGSNLAGATNAWLTLSAVQFDQAGEYSVLVTNALGSVISSNAELTVQSCDPDPLGLVSWWPGDGTAQDVMGLNNGVLEGGVGFTNGEVGQAFWFADPTADVRIPASGSLDVGTGAGFTVEAWINCATGTQLNPIFEWNPGDGVTQEGVHFYVWSEGSLYGNVVDAGGKVTDDAFYSDPDLILPNVFYHVALTYDQASGVEAMYLNGLLVADEILGPITPQTSYDLYLGRRPPTAGATYEFSGALDAPAVYNRALSPAELRAIFQAGVNGKCGPFNAPVVLLSPASQTAAVGRDVVFSVAALGAPPLTYQWWFNGTPIFAAATNATLTLTNLEFSAAGNYSVTVSNLYGSAASSNAGLLVVAQPPAISTQPDNQTVEVGGTVSFTVSASGSLPQSFQWSFAGAALAGATNATLTLLDVQPDQAGDYRVVVTNALGSAASSNAVLLVEFCDPDPAGLVSWWPGAGNALDYMGTNNGVLEGGVGFTNGEVGRAFWFNNASADVRIPASASLNVGTRGGFTVEAWVKCATVTQLNPIFEWNQGDAVTNEGAHLYVYSNGALYGNVVGTNGAVVKNVFYSSAGLVASNVFYHVALTYDQVAGMEFLYLNGVLVARKSIGSITPQTSFDLYLGRRPPTQGETYSFAGTIDEPSLYDRALSAAELLAIYQAGSGGKCLPAVVPTIHFTWAPLPALRFVNVPFTATIQAQNATNGPATNFVGTVALTATPGVALTPSVSGAFRQGTWTGMLTVGQPVSNLVLQASDGLGDTGLANAINIVNPPGLSSVCSGGNLLLLWPSALPGFVMETAPALNATNWVPVSTPPTQIGGQFLESLPLAATNAFFRLRYVAP
jgi:hypothetical protein